MQDFKQLVVWQKAHQLTLGVYAATRQFPRHERGGLTNQLRRACVSIPSNIVEGAGRNSGPDFARFLQIAMGSASEVEYQLLLSRDLGYLPSEDYAKLSQAVIEVRRMLTSLRQKVKTGYKTQP